MSNPAEQIDLSAIDVEEVVKMVGAAGDEQLKEVMESEQREAILSEVFSQMEEHYRPGPAPAEAVLRWVITGRSDGGQDEWHVALKDGSCKVSREPVGDPRVTFTMDGPTFLRLVTGNAAGPMLFISGKLKIEGDIPFAAQVQSLFEIPS
jgi:putative sterol carrier protein